MTAPPALPLAVYGTLRPGGRAYAAFDLARRTRPLGHCRIPGRLIDLGGFPGLIDGTGVVIGDLLAIDDPLLLGELDAYEGADYGRVTVRLIQPAVDALIWRWLGPVDGAAAVPGNDWAQRVSAEIDPAMPAGRR